MRPHRSPRHAASAEAPSGPRASTLATFRSLTLVAQARPLCGGCCQSSLRCDHPLCTTYLTFGPEAMRHANHPTRKSRWQLAQEPEAVFFISCSAQDQPAHPQPIAGDEYCPRNCFQLIGDVDVLLQLLCEPRQDGLFE